MGYIKYIREMVGHKPVIACGASVLLFNANGELLLQRRSDNNYWGYAGGTVEMDEKVEEAARRELFEETGLVANSLELFGVFSGKKLHHIYPNGDELSIIDIVFICRDYAGELLAQREEVNELAFFEIDKLPPMITPPAIPIIDALRKYNGKQGNNSHLKYTFTNEL